MGRPKPEHKPVPSNLWLSAAAYGSGLNSNVKLH
jgi:hypothetical protein